MLPEDTSHYLAELVTRLNDAIALHGVFLIGSAAIGGYDPPRSDLDVMAFAGTPVTSEQRETIVATCSHEALPCPARKLELVIYEPDGVTVALNLNTGPDETTTDDAEPFWFVLDRAIARDHALVLVGPPPKDVIAPIDDATVEQALTESVAWWRANEPGPAAEVAARRAAVWHDRRVWLSKRDV